MCAPVPVDPQCCVEDPRVGDCSVRARMDCLDMLNAAANVSFTFGFG